MKKLLVSALVFSAFSAINAADSGGVVELTQEVEELNLNSDRNKEYTSPFFMNDPDQERREAQALKNKRNQEFRDLRKRYDQIKKMSDSPQKTEDMRNFLKNLKAKKMGFIEASHSKWATDILRMNQRRYGIR